MPDHKSLEDLKTYLPHILAAPKDEGRLEMILSRPGHGERKVLDNAFLSLANGVPGDHWIKGCHVEDENGNPHPDVQICIMPARVIAAIAGDKENWPPAGDNLFFEMDTTPSNLPPGTRITIGDAVLQITEEPHNGCQNFIDRYGRDACLFVNTGEGKTQRLRGIYARVIKDGEVKTGDVIRKLP